MEATYSCGAAACHRLRRHPRLGDSRAELELVNSLEWRPLGLTMRGPQLLADYVSYLTYGNIGVSFPNQCDYVA